MNYDPNNIIILDDILPKWLHDQSVLNIPHIPVKFGHRGLGATNSLVINGQIQN